MARQGFTFSDGNVAANVLEDRIWWAGFQNGLFHVEPGSLGQEFQSGCKPLWGNWTQPNDLQIFIGNEGDTSTLFADLSNVLQHYDADNDVWTCQPGDTGSGQLFKGNTMGKSITWTAF